MTSVDDLVHECCDYGVELKPGDMVLDARGTILYIGDMDPQRSLVMKGTNLKLWPKKEIEWAFFLRTIKLKSLQAVER